MCGIAGYISLNNSVSEQQLRLAASLMQHRGPDAADFYFSDDKTVGLAHRRLSILDLSSSANQPMFSADGRYCIVFNGEVYNFKELRDVFYLNPKVWKKLGFLPTKNIDKIKEYIPKDDHLKVSKTHLLMKNFGQWFKTSKIMRPTYKPEFEPYFKKHS